jgi:hypothetical protein
LARLRPAERPRRPAGKDDRDGAMGGQRHCAPGADCRVTALPPEKVRPSCRCRLQRDEGSFGVELRAVLPAVDACRYRCNRAGTNDDGLGSYRPLLNGEREVRTVRPPRSWLR